jgi:hypothetical protein
MCLGCAASVTVPVPFGVQYIAAVEVYNHFSESGLLNFCGPPWRLGAIRTFGQISASIASRSPFFPWRQPMSWEPIFEHLKTQTRVSEACVFLLAWPRCCASLLSAVTVRNCGAVCGRGPMVGVQVCIKRALAWTGGDGIIKEDFTVDMEKFQRAMDTADDRFAAWPMRILPYLIRVQRWRYNVVGEVRNQSLRRPLGRVGLVVARVVAVVCCSTSSSVLLLFFPRRVGTLTLLMLPKRLRPRSALPRASPSDGPRGQARTRSGCGKKRRLQPLQPLQPLSLWLVWTAAVRSVAVGAVAVGAVAVGAVAVGAVAVGAVAVGAVAVGSVAVGAVAVVVAAEGQQGRLRPVGPPLSRFTHHRRLRRTVDVLSPTKAGPVLSPHPPPRWAHLLGGVRL